MNMLPYRAKGLCRHVKIKDMRMGRFSRWAQSHHMTLKKMEEETRRVNREMLHEKD